MIAIGIDAGAEGGVSVVQLAGSPAVPLLLCSMRVHGSTWPKWLTSARHAVSSCPPGTVCYLEAATAMRAGPMRSTVTMGKLGERRGALHALAWAHGLEVVEVGPGDWARECRVRVGKAGDGSHRIAEAAMVVGARDALAEMPRCAVINCAESILIALAGCLRGGR